MCNVSITNCLALEKFCSSFTAVISSSWTVLAVLLYSCTVSWRNFAASLEKKADTWEGVRKSSMVKRRSPLGPLARRISFATSCGFVWAPNPLHFVLFSWLSGLFQPTRELSPLLQLASQHSPPLPGLIASPYLVMICTCRTASASPSLNISEILWNSHLVDSCTSLGYQGFPFSLVLEAQ